MEASHITELRAALDASQARSRVQINALPKGHGARKSLAPQIARVNA